MVRYRYHRIRSLPIRTAQRSPLAASVRTGFLERRAFLHIPTSKIAPIPLVSYTGLLGGRAPSGVPRPRRAGHGRPSPCGAAVASTRAGNPAVSRSTLPCTSRGLADPLYAERAAIGTTLAGQPAVSMRRCPGHLSLIHI